MKNPNPLMDIRLEEVVWREVVKALASSPDAGNYLVESARLAIQQALIQRGDQHG